MSGRLRGAAPALGAALLAFAVLLPAVHTPLRFDDTMLYELRTSLDVLGPPFGEFLGRQFETTFDASRVQPLGPLLVTVPWAFSGATVAYKLFLIALTVLALVAWHRVLRRLGVPVALGVAAIAAGAGLMQFRSYHDAVLGYGGMPQISLLLAAAAALAWLRWDDPGGRRRDLALAVAAWVACLAIYEGNVALLALVAAPVIARRRRRALRGLAPFLVPAAVCVAAILALRLTADSIGGAYEPGGGPGAALATWLRSLVAPLPVSYLLTRESAFLDQPTVPELLAGAWRGLAVGIVAAVATARAARAPELGGATSRALAGAALAGAALWIAPSAPLAVAPKYQDELTLGVGYITVIGQVIGVAILLAVLATLLIRGARRAGRVAGAASVVLTGTLMGIAVGATGTANMRVVAIEWQTARSRSLLEEALSRGILAPLPERSTVIAAARDLNWYPVNFGLDKRTFDVVTFAHSGRRLDMRLGGYLEPATCPSRIGEWPPPVCAPVAREGGWLFVQPVRGGGVAVLARSPAGRVRSGEAPPVSLTAFVQGDGAGRPPLLEGSAPIGPWTSAGNVVWSQTRRDDDWALWHGTLPPGRPAPVASTIDVAGTRMSFVDPPPPAVRVRELGTRGLLP